MTTTLTFTSNGSFDKPAVKSVAVRCWGAGGGGVGADSSNSGHAGAGGGYGEKTLTITADTVYSIVVGTGGSGSTNYGTPSAGGDSYWDDGSQVKGFGGGAGIVGGSTTSTGGSGTGTTTHTGGSGGLGDTNIAGGGGGGGAGTTNDGSAGVDGSSGGTGGSGGATDGGNGGNGGSLGSDGSSGSVYGGGGGGGSVNFLGTTGGSGANGKVEVDYTPGYISFSATPSNTPINAILSLAVQVKCADNTVDTNYTGNVTITIGANPSGGVLSGTTTLPCVAGAVTFTDLSIDKAGNAYTLVATATDLDTGTTPTFNITALEGTSFIRAVAKTNIRAGKLVSLQTAISARSKLFDKLALIVGNTSTVKSLSLITDKAGGSVRFTTAIPTVAKVNDKLGGVLIFKSSIRSLANIYNSGISALYNPRYINQIIFPNSGILSYWSGSGLRIPQGDSLQNLSGYTGSNSIVTAIQDGTASLTASSFWTNDTQTSKVFDSWFDVPFSPILINQSGVYGRLAYDLSAGAGVGVAISGTNLYFKAANNSGLNSDVLFASGILTDITGNTSGIKNINFVIQSGNRSLFPTVNPIVSMSGHLISTSSFTGNSGVLRFLDLDISVSGTYTYNYLPLYMNGDYNSGIVSSGFYLMTQVLGVESGILNLYLRGPIPNSGNSSVNLTTFATSPGVNGIYSQVPLTIGYQAGTPDPRYSLPLYLNNSENNQSVSSLNLYVNNDTTTTKQLNLFTSNTYTTVNSGLNLYTAAPSGTTGAVPYSGQMNLFIARDTEGVYGTVPMMTKVNESSIGGVNMYIPGANFSFKLLNLYQRAIESGTIQNLRMYTRGF